MFKPVWMTLPLQMTSTFTQDHRVMRKNSHNQSPVEWHEVAKIFLAVDYVSSTTATNPESMAEYECMNICSFCLFLNNGQGGAKVTNW